MASALDRQLNEYRSRPRDESGARKTKESLIYDPRQASFIDNDTIYQMGYQGYLKLCERDDRFTDYGSSIFSYTNIQIDPLFLTNPENQQIFEKIESLLYLLTDYILLQEAVYVLEYLIRQFAINRLRPGHLIISVLPYLEKSFFVRVIQTIPFKDLRGNPEHKFLKEFQPVKESKQPINRKVLRDMIEKRSDLLHWIISHAFPISALHPQGTFVAFASVLFTEIGLNSKNDKILGSIIETCRASFESDNQALAPNLIMAVAAINAKQQLHDKVIRKFSKLLFTSPELIDDHFRTIMMASQYFSSRPYTNQETNQMKPHLPCVEFIISAGVHIHELDELVNEYDLAPLPELFVKVISTNLENDDLLRSVIAILETDFFKDVITLFFNEIIPNYVKTEFSENLIQSIASHYPESLTIDIVNKLKEIDIEIQPSQVAPRNLIKQLSNPKIAASLYSNPNLPYETAQMQVIPSLLAAQASENPEPIISIIEYFKQSLPTPLLEFFCNSLLINESSEFSVALNSALSKYGSQLAPYFEGLPNTNQAILDHLVKYLQDNENNSLPDFHILPFALARALFSGDVVEALQFLPIKNDIDYDKAQSLLGNNEISVASNEHIIATILSVVDSVLIRNDESISSEAISLLLNFPDIRCVASLLKRITDQKKIYAVFEQTGPKLQESATLEMSMKRKRIRMNYIYYISAQCQKIEDPTIILPTLYMALLSPDLVEETTLALKSVPLKNKNIKKTLTSILRQSTLFEQANSDLHEQNLRSVFESALKSQNGREFFDLLWNNIYTPQGCSQFWRITHDIGVISILPRFDSDQSGEIAAIVSQFLQQYPDDESCMKFAIDSLRPPLMRAAIPYLPYSYITDIVPVVCAYPKYFSSAFSEFFLSHEIDCTNLVPFLRDNPAKLINKSDISDSNNGMTTIDPPEQLKSLRLKTKYVISPATLIMELIPIANQKHQLENIGAILPALFAILKTHKQHHLIFPILNVCIESSSDYMIKNFGVIIDSLSHSPVPHIHSSALELIRSLANIDPASIAKYASFLFSALSGATVFTDDTANLIKIKQLLSSILPVLSKTNNIDQLLNYFAINIENFSLERSSQLILHSIDVLKDHSFQVFYSLLSNQQSKFALIIAEQMKPEQLITALINLLDLPPIPYSDPKEGDDIVVDFILQITLPPIPKQIYELFVKLSNRIEIFDYLQSTFNNFALQDFIKVFIEFLPGDISISSIIQKRIEEESSPLFYELLEPLQKELSKYHLLEENLKILSDIITCLNNDQSSKLVPVIETIVNTVDDSPAYTVENKVHALCFMASAVERFNLTLFEAFQQVIDFSVQLYSMIVSEKMTLFIRNATASICLLLKTAVIITMPALPKLWSYMISPLVVESDPVLYKVVQDSMMNTTSKTSLSSDLLKAFIVAYKDNKAHAPSITLIFDALGNNLKSTDLTTIKENLQKLVKFFYLAFANQVKTEWENILTVQDSIINAFCILLSQLDKPHLRGTLRAIIDFFKALMVREDTKGNDYVYFRFLFARIMIKVTSGLERILEQTYEELLRICLDELLGLKDESIDDSETLNRQLTVEALSLLSNIIKYSNDDLFNADYFNQSLKAIIRHVEPVTEETEEYVEKIVGSLAPTYADLINSTRNDQLWRVANQEMFDLAKNEDYRVRVAVLQLADKAFEIVGVELKAIMPELAPHLYELTDDPDKGVQQLARQTIANIDSYIGDEFESYFQ